MQHGSPPGLWEGGSALVVQGGQVGKPTAEEHQIYEKIYIIFTPLCSPEKEAPPFLYQNVVCIDIDTTKTK